MAKNIDQPLKTFFFEAGFFILTLLLGFFSGWQMKSLYGQWLVMAEPISIARFFFSFAIATLFILWLIYFVRSKRSKKIFFKLFFLLSAIAGNLIFFNLWLSDWLCLILVLIMVFLWLKKPTLLIHNLFLIFAMAGIGARIGLDLQPEAVILLLIVFSVYDFVAVYKTKYMVEIAREMVSQKAILGLIIPQKFSDFKIKLTEIETNGKFLILGAGDIVFPLLFVVSALSKGVFQAFSVALFSFIGLTMGFLFFVSRKERQPMPALPLIALFSILGYLLSQLALKIIS